MAGQGSKALGILVRQVSQDEGKNNAKLAKCGVGIGGKGSDRVKTRDSYFGNPSRLCMAMETLWKICPIQVTQSAGNAKRVAVQSIHTLPPPLKVPQNVARFSPE